MLAYKDTRIFTEAISGSQINRDGLNTLQLKIEKVMSFYTLNSTMLRRHSYQHKTTVQDHCENLSHSLKFRLGSFSTTPLLHLEMLVFPIPLIHMHPLV